MRWLIFNIFLFLNIFYITSASGESILIVCAKPETVLADGKNYLLREKSYKKMEPIAIQLDVIEKKARFRRLGKWSPWSIAQFNENEVIWDLMDIKNTNIQDIKALENFEYWKFNLDLVNRQVFENFVEKTGEGVETKPKPRGFIYPDCKKADPMKLSK